MIDTFNFAPVYIINLSFIGNRHIYYYISFRFVGEFNIALEFMILNTFSWIFAGICTSLFTLLAELVEYTTKNVVYESKKF